MISEIVVLLFEFEFSGIVIIYLKIISKINLQFKKNELYVII